MNTSPEHANRQPPTLKRSLSLPLITLYGLGNILGAGIYVLIGKVVLHAGIFAPLSFLVASLLACLTAFTYAELSARYPLSAGEAVYVQQGLGIQALSAVVGLLIIFAGIVSSATLLRGFTGYLQVFVAAPETVTILLLVLVLGGLAAWGITESVRAAVFITALEIVGLLMIVAVAAPDMLAGKAMAAGFSLLPGIEAWYGIFVGGFLAFYAFIGFEDMVNVAEEVKQPRINMPRALLLSLAIAATLYFLVAFAAISSIPGNLLAESDAPLAFLYQQVTGRNPVVITLIGMFAVINGALIQIIMASRVCYGMSRQHWLPPLFGKINAATRTPLIATAAVAIIVFLMAVWLPIETLAKATSYFLLLVFTLVNLSLWRLKRSGRHPDGIIHVPIWVPAVGFIASFGFVVLQLLIDLGST